MRHLFDNPALFDLAMTHCGMVGELNNQRLEFLGDRVLGLVIAEMVYHHFPEANEGDLARRHAALVCGETLSTIAHKLGLSEEMRVSLSDESLGVRENMAALEDACEALIGALYLDRGLEVVQAFIHEHWLPLLDHMKMPPKDPKTRLQEWAQSRGLPLPMYSVVKREGAAHAPIFTIEVQVEGITPMVGVASVKRVAEQEAARQLLLHVGEIA
jgi:ribonuclease-3